MIAKGGDALIDSERPEGEDLSLIPLSRLARDIRNAARLLGPREIRYLVDLYYQMQEERKASGNQVRSLFEAAEPNAIVQWTHASMRQIEDSVKGALQVAAQAQHMGTWAMSVKGVGPVLAAGLIAHIEIEKAPTVSHIWRFAGLDPTSVWEKGQKRPWNARLKVICWKLGESFVKQQNRDGDVYGHLFLQRKRLEWERNLRGEFAAQATDLSGKFKKETDSYPWYAGHYTPRVGQSNPDLAGQMMHVEAPRRHSDLLTALPPVAGASVAMGLPMLPPGHIHSRAKRWAVKCFLVDYHREAYKERFGKEPPLPYALEHLDGHTDFRVYGTDRYISVDQARELLGLGAR